MADEACATVVEQAKSDIEGSILCVDGGWSSRRQARECSVYACWGIYIIARAHVMKLFTNEKVNTLVRRDYVGSSQGMEVEGSDRIMRYLKNNGVVVSGLVHDEDTKDMEVFYIYLYICVTHIILYV